MSPIFGLRYSTPLVTAGGMVSPTEGKLHCLWLVSFCLPEHQDLLQQAFVSAASQISKMLSELNQSFDTAAEAYLSVLPFGLEAEMGCFCRLSCAHLFCELRQPPAKVS